MAAGALSQAVAVVVQMIMKMLGGSTPRKIVCSIFLLLS